MSRLILPNNRVLRRVKESSLRGSNDNQQPKDTWSRWQPRDLKKGGKGGRRAMTGGKWKEDVGEILIEKVHRKK